MTMLKMFVVLIHFASIILNFSEAYESYLELTDSNFNEEITKFPVSLVKFYAPWCGHCKNLAPVFSKAAERLQGIAQLIKVNCDNEKSICGAHNIKGFPTLKIFKDGVFIEDYNSGRDEDSIVQTMKKHSSPSSKLFASKNEIENILKDNHRYVVVGYLSKKYESTFTALSAKMRDSYDFVHILDESITESKIQLHKPVHLKSNIEVSVYEDVLDTVDGAEEFINKNRNGLVGECTVEQRHLFNLPLLTVKLPFNPLISLSSWKQYRNRLLKLTQSISDLNICVIQQNEFNKIFSTLNEEVLSVSLVIENKDGFRFLQQFEPTSATDLSQKVTEFIDAFKSNKIEPVESVMSLTSSNFAENVFNSGKYSLIKFYAPWCGHCKKLAPIYEELSKKFRGNKLVNIAKLDATVHQPSSQFKVEGFPTIYFVKKDDPNNPIKYEGERTLESFTEFIEKNIPSDEL